MSGQYAAKTELALALENPDCELCGSSNKEAVITTQDYETPFSNHFQVSRCTDCGLLYTAPRPAFQDLLDHFYQDSYLCYNRAGLADKLRSSWQGKAFLRSMQRFMQPGGHLLEVGCAGGDLLAYVQGCTNWQISACEPKEEVAAQARAKGVDVRGATLVEANYDDNTFDVVYMSHVIEHLPDVAGTLAEVHRILKPGGLFVSENPDIGGRTRAWFGSSWWGYHLPRHLTHFSRDTMSSMLANAGLTVESIDACFRPSLLAWSIHNYLKAVKGWPRLAKVLSQNNPLFIIALFPFEWLFTRGNRGDVMEVRARKT